jgi:hypothetical protein
MTSNISPSGYRPRRDNGGRQRGRVGRRVKGKRTPQGDSLIGKSGIVLIGEVVALGANWLFWTSISCLDSPI